MLKGSGRGRLFYCVALGLLCIIHLGCAEHGARAGLGAGLPVQDLEDPQGSQPESIVPTTYEIQVPGKASSEKCVVTERFPDTTYPALKDETKLCGYNLYRTASNHTSNKVLYNCPKVHNTSIAIELYKAPTEMTLERFQKTVCPLSKGGKVRLKAEKGFPNKEAKFKFNSAGVSVGSTLGYYHLANFFDAVLVPPVVLRTVDVDTVLDHALAGRYFARNLKNPYLDRYYATQVSLLVTTKHGPQQKLPPQYTSLDRGLGLVPPDFYSSAENSRVAPVNLNYWASRQLIAGRTQVYGVLALNPGGESNYVEASGTKNEKLRVDRFRNSSAFYLALKDGRPIEQILGSRDLKSAGQMLQGMQDVSAMLVLDFLFDQSDRIGNIHYYKYHFFKDGKGRLRNISDKKFKKLLKANSDQLSSQEKELIEAVKIGGVPLKVMLLKDNDGGFDLNMVKKYQLIANIQRDPAQYASWKGHTEPYLKSDLVVRHFNPKVYRGIMKLKKWVLEDPQMIGKMSNYFINDLRFSVGEYETFKTNLLSLYRILYHHCQSGRLHLDLDMSSYFSDNPSQHSTSTPGVCEGEF